MQLNPARGRKRANAKIETPCKFYGLCSSTPRGDGNPTSMLCQNINVLGLCSSTPRGDGNVRVALSSASITLSRFMQLNPARGRKLLSLANPDNRRELGLCSSTPRGDGNLVDLEDFLEDNKPGFMQLNPARGRKRRHIKHGVLVRAQGLCSSTPRGDGNSPMAANTSISIFKVYAAQPREGTETWW